MSYDRDGFQIVEAVLSPRDCDLLNCEVDSVFPYGPHIAMVHRDLGAFLALLKYSVIVNAAASLLCSDVVAVNSEYFFGRPGTKGFNRHQDNYYLGSPVGSSISCWIALTDVDPGNGCLFVYPGSHKFGMQPIARPDADNRVDQCDLPPGALLGLSPVPLAKGDAILMAGELVHGSYTNGSTRNRESVTLAYVKKGAPFRPGRLGRVAIDVG